MNFNELLIDQVGTSIHSSQNISQPFTKNSIDNLESRYNSYVFKARQLRMFLGITNPLNTFLVKTSLMKSGLSSVEELEELVSEVKLKLSHADADSRVFRIFPKTTTKTKRKVYAGAVPSDSADTNPFSSDQIKNTIEKVSKTLGRTKIQENITNEKSSLNLSSNVYSNVSSSYEAPIAPSLTVSLPSAEYQPITIRYRSEYYFEDAVEFDTIPESISVIGLSHFGTAELLNYFSVTYSFKVNSKWFNLSPSQVGISFVPGKRNHVYIDDTPENIIARVTIKRIKTIPEKLLEIFSPEKAGLELVNFVQFESLNKFTLPPSVGKVHNCFNVSDFYYGSKYSFKEVSLNTLKELDLNFLKSNIYPYEKLQVKLDGHDMALISSTDSFTSAYQYKISNSKMVFSTSLASLYGGSDIARLEYKYPLENIDVSLFDSGIELNLLDFSYIDSFFVDLDKITSTSQNKHYDFSYVLENIYKVTLPEYETIESLSLVDSTSSLSQITGNTFYDLNLDGQYYLEDNNSDIYFYFDNSPNSSKLKINYSLKENVEKVDFVTKDSNKILINSFNVQQTSFTIPKNTLEYSLSTDIFFFVNDSDNLYSYKKSQLKSNDYLTDLKIYRDNFSSGTSDFVVPNFKLGESKEVVYKDSGLNIIGTATTTSNVVSLGTDLDFVYLDMSPLGGLSSSEFTYKPSENKLVFGSVSATDFSIRGYKLDLSLSIKDHAKVSYNLDKQGRIQSTATGIFLVHSPYIDDLRNLEQSYYTLSPKYFDLLVKE